MRISKFLLSVFVLAVFCVVFSVSAKKVSAQAAATQFWIQLNAEPYQADGRLFMILTTGSNPQRTNGTVYIAECIDTVDDRVCTTGTKEGDMAVYASDENLVKMQQNFGYIFRNLYQPGGKTVIQNPVQSDAQGKISITWLESSINSDAKRRFYGVNIIKGNEAGKAATELEKIGVGFEGGQQQGGFFVEIPTPVPTKAVIQQQAAPEASSSCSDGWDDVKNEPCCKPRTGDRDDACDPYGRVFDAVSLEPIPNVRVTLFKQRQDQAFTFMSPKETVNAFINPWTTKDDGKYLFMVPPPGVFQLDIASPDYSFPINSGQLNPNFSKAYFEIYYGSGFTDKNIVENEKVEHRDIPLVPKGTPFRSPVKLLGYISELDKQKEEYQVSGRVSHPLTIVEIQGKQIDTNAVTRTLVKLQADKWGLFNTKIKTSMLKQNETVGSAKLTKVDLTQTGAAAPTSFFGKIFSWIKEVNAQTSLLSSLPRSFPLNPILNYIEGYAYDSSGRVLPNAKVDIYLTGSKKPYFETTTNTNGYFIITSQHLPQMNYVISYKTTAGGINTITQGQFLGENLKTIVSKNINVNKYTTRLPPFNVSAQERGQLSTPTNPPIQNAVQAIKENPNIIFILILIGLLIVVGIVGAVYMRRKRKEMPPLPPPVSS